MGLFTNSKLDKIAIQMEKLINDADSWYMKNMPEKVAEDVLREIFRNEVQKAFDDGRIRDVLQQAVDVGMENFLKEHSVEVYETVFKELTQQKVKEQIMNNLNLPVLLNTPNNDY